VFQEVSRESDGSRCAAVSSLHNSSLHAKVMPEVCSSSHSYHSRPSSVARFSILEVHAIMILAMNLIPVSCEELVGCTL
jgi:hypothetical protein